MSLRIFALSAGSCLHPEFTVMQGGALRQRTFPASVIYIEHPKHGRILFDTGYSERFFAATARFPEKIYALVTPVTVRPEDTAAAQLKAKGIAPDTIDIVILSHFHADHIAGVGDFPKARFVFLDRAYREVMSWDRWKSLRKGFLRDLLPSDFARRATPVSAPARRDMIAACSDFDQFDLLGDGSLIGVALPGHAPGHMGLWVEGEGGPTFFVADACWLGEQLENGRGPLAIARIIMDEPRQYAVTLATLVKLKKAHPRLAVIPCHCSRSLGTLASFAAK